MHGTTFIPDRGVEESRLLAHPGPPAWFGLRAEPVLSGTNHVFSDEPDDIGQIVSGIAATPRDRGARR